MGIDRLTKAANAAGYAMANSEELLEPAPRKGEANSWRPAYPVPVQRALPRPQLEAPKPVSSFRDWWFTVSNKVTA